MRDLISGAEDVCVVLLEASHSSQTRQSARQFVSVKDSEVGES